MSFIRGGAARSGKREFYTATALALSLFAFLLFASPAWAQERREPVSEAQKNRIEGLSDSQAQEEFGRATQAAARDSSGDLVGDRVVEEDNDGNNLIDLVRILDAQDCIVEENATIVFEDRNNPGDLFTVVDNLNVQITDPGNEIRVRDIREKGDTNDDIEFFNEQGQLVPLNRNTVRLDVENSSGIDCDGDEDDGFDDELLFLLLLELLEDNDDGDDNGNDDGDGGDDGDGDDGDPEGDLDGDGDVDQDDEALSAENDLNGENTDGQYDDELGEEDGGVSASSNEDGAEASTPGASASSGGDPDEQEPVSEPQGDVEDEIPTSGPLPNTGGVPVAAGTVLALVLFGAGLLLVRLVMLWRERRA